MNGEFATLHCNRKGETRKIVLSSGSREKRKALIIEGEHCITFLSVFLIERILSSGNYDKRERFAMLNLIKEGLPTMKHICGEMKSNS